METPILNSFPLQEKEAAERAFTLVELIVVITILAILWTIAFISLQGYSRDARDSTRTADLWNMKTSLELYSLKTWKYPEPDTPSQISYSGWVVWYQWTLWTKVTTNLKSLNEVPLDPLTNTEYIYSTTQSYKEYEVLALFEWNIAYNQVPSPIRRGLGWGLIPTANAATTSLTPKIVWNYNQVFVKTPNYIIPTPSIITSEPWSIVLDWTTIKSQIVTNWANIPKTSVTNTKTWALDVKLSVYTWSINKNSTGREKINVMKQIQLAYSWTSLSSNKNISNVLNLKWNKELSDLTNSLLLNGITIKKFWDWRDIDPICDIPDIKIWNQTWAWCNSTLWNWIEYNVDQNCFNYQWWTTTWCNRPSNEKENIYNPTYGINNIWWKLYTWANSPSACTTWYHVPSDEEWYNLEVALWSTTRSNNWLYSWIQNWWLSTWLWWSGHTTKSSSNNIVQALKLPLSGYRYVSGVPFYHRGFNTHLWSSSSFSANAYARHFLWNTPAVNRDFWTKASGFSVRCLKD